MKTQKCLSPTKQNVSPSKQVFRQNQNIGQLLAFIKASGLKIPGHLQKKYANCSNGLLKLKTTQNSSQDIKKLKVKLGDSQFELKKIQEDFAQFKLVSRQQKQKQVRKWEEAFNKLKSTLENTNEDSSIKILKLKENSQKQLMELKQKHEAELKQQIEKLKKIYQDRLEAQKKLKDREVTELKIKFSHQISELTKKHQDQIQEMKKSYEFEMRKQSIKHKQYLQNKQKNFESVYTAIQSQKKTEEKLHQKTKIQANQAKEKLYAELYLQRNLKKGLQEDVQRLEKQIKSLKSTIRDLQINMQLEKDKANQKQKQIINNFQLQKQGQEQIHKQKMVNLLSAQQKELMKFQEKIKELSEWKNNSEVLMDEKLSQIQKIFNNRPSRKEDIEMIQKIRGKLLRKQEEARLLNKQLKACALEIQNKQETYNKIFTSSTANKLEKRSLAKDRQDAKSRDSLCRKSQTTDLKFLLKVYNKHL